VLAAAFALGGCKSEEEKREAAWHEAFDPLAARYLAQDGEGTPEIAPEKVKGRKVLILPRLYGATPAPEEAHAADEVGIAVTWSVKDDALPSRTYEHGIEGYGGTVKLAAFAHPEGKRIAFETWHCNPPTSIYRMTSLQTGATAKYDEHCTPSGDSIREFAASIAGGRAPEGSNASDESNKAFDAIALGYAKRLDGPVAKPLDVRGRKILLYYVDDGAAPKLYHNEYLLPASAYAASPAEVGLFAVARSTHEARPSMRYSNGAEGYEGKAEVILIAHPEGRLLARTTVPCTLSSEDIVVNVLMAKEPQRCSGEGAEIRAAIEKLVGPLGPGKK
jgi:hypothetical protein